METEMLAFFGLDITTLLMIAGIVYFFVEAFKGKFPKVFLGGIRTDILALLISGGASFKVYGTQWEQLIVCTIICWLAPAGLHKLIKEKR